MRWLAERIKWIMLVSGLLTCSMFYAAIAPQAALRSTFGEELQGPVAQIVVRNWGALIGLGGLMLVYGAFHAPSRRLVLAVVGASKLVFIGLVLAYGREYLGHQAGIAVVADTAAVLLFAACLLGARSHAAA